MQEVKETHASIYKQVLMKLQFEAKGTEGIKFETALDEEIKWANDQLPKSSPLDTDAPAEAKQIKAELQSIQKRLANVLAKQEGKKGEVSLKLARLFRMPVVKQLFKWNIGKASSALLGDPISKAKALLTAQTATFTDHVLPWKGKEGDVGENLTSTIIPANRSASHLPVSSRTMHDRKETGVSSNNNMRTSDRASNLQMTSLKQNGKTIFSGVRHAIVATKNADPKTTTCPGHNHPISDMGKQEIQIYISSHKDAISASSFEKITALLKKDKLGPAQNLLAKEVANRTKSLDLLRAAVVQKLNAIKESDPAFDLSQLNSLKIDLTSISLITPDEFRAFIKYDEKQMITEQHAALTALENLSQEEKEALFSDLVGENNAPLFSGSTPNLEVSSAVFNIGVNEGERFGRTNQKAMNESGMVKLLDRADAKKAAIAALLADPNKSTKEIQTALRNIGIYASTAEIESPKFKAKLDTELQLIVTLRERVSQEFTAFQQLDGIQPNTYLLPTLIGALNQSLEGSLCFNCKSGKDRTGMFDVMGKLLMTHIRESIAESPNNPTVAIEKGISFFDKTTGITQALDKAKVFKDFGYNMSEWNAAQMNEASKKSGINNDDLTWMKAQQTRNLDMAQNSGNYEVQQENTTGKGYRLKGDAMQGRANENMFKMFFGIPDLSTLHMASFMFSS